MKVLIVVPVYNAEPMVHDVVEKLMKAESFSVLVVDDGSRPQLELKMNDKNLNLLKLETNQGKGEALQQAMHWASEKSYTHILSIDGDGQHQVEDIPLLIEESQKFPEHVVIGKRRFDETVPGVSRFGRSFSNFWVKYQTGVKLSDTQSGLRLYPLQKLKDVHFFSKRYDFEIEILVRAIWKGVGVSEVEVGVIYPAKEDRVSHFNKLWDNLRITLLNIALIAYSLIFYQRGLVKVFLAGALGFITSLFFSPWLGLAFGIFTCVLLRLNVILMFLGFLILRIV